MTWTPTTASAPTTGRGRRVYVGDDHPYPLALDDIIGLDAVPVQVHADGTITERRDVYRPEVYADLDDDGSYLPGAQADAAAQLDRDGWEPLRGYTGQHGAGASSWFMHASEFIGGRLADDIATKPGVYVAVMVSLMTDAEPSEWAVLRRTA